MKIFYSETHRKHNPPFEVFDGGLRAPYLENPDRMDRILNALRETDWAEIHEPSDFGLDPIRAVHDKEYLDFLASCWTEWLDSKPKDPSLFLPATFALRHQPQKPKSLLGRGGYYIMDLSACIVEGTYPAALASANCSLSAASSVVNGQSSAFALCRPPGHHAGKDYAGGYCFINNAAVAAHWLSSKGNVAVIDIDYHCGNGTQDIFYERDDVLTISIHADPDFEYPAYFGFANERGKDAGFGYHHNFPLPKGTDDEAYLATLDRALELIREYKPAHLVVSAGMDIYADDPLGTIKVSTEGIREIGRRIASLKLPSVVVMEGGYNNEALGRNITAFLGEFK
ncbi:MAG TPA: histone deacetylase family protein [Anaerolineales bacterium]|nr:histone deacetylase family protein [Anaerolineales bacterium]HNQ95962.1 histone deacetylase family protein [Anaerolineales bacterium]HNS61014.1 histone deacetylase family protein [Anaerolineales bacterium]